MAAKILIVDDDPELLELIQDALSMEDFEIEAVDEGGKALQRIEKVAYDLLILDWNLPAVSGIDLCRTYRRYGGKSPVMMLTGKSGVKDKVKGLEGGADDYMTKPFQVEELLARVKALLRRSSGVFPTE
jgi:DNA-binding response OmpR family regulator